jgi:hypothetical protein
MTTVAMVARRGRHNPFRFDLLVVIPPAPSRSLTPTGKGKCRIKESSPHTRLRAHGRALHPTLVMRGVTTSLGRGIAASAAGSTISGGATAVLTSSFNPESTWGPSLV